MIAYSGSLGPLHISFLFFDISLKKKCDLICTISVSARQLPSYCSVRDQRTMQISGHVLGIWICWCSLFYKREPWASKSAGAHSTKNLKISRCKRWCPKDLRVCAPVLMHSLNANFNFHFRLRFEIFAVILDHLKISQVAKIQEM